jgi:PAS domain-containing protein
MPLAAALLSIDSFPEELLEAVLDVSLTGIKVLSPRYSSSGELDDFAPEYLNPAARRMTGLAEQPDGTARAHFPDIFTNGLFDFYRRVFETGEAGRLEVTYQADGPDHYLQVAARRSGERLVVSFNDTGYQDCSAMEAALRESKAREQQAEAERRRLHDILMQMPAQVAVHHGSDHLFELVNPRYQQKFPTRAIQGKPMHEALPGLEGQQFFGLLDHVYQTGEPFYGPEMPVQVDFTSTGRMELRYFDVFFKALHNAQGSLDGILNFSYDVTGQVLARQRAEGLNGELEARLQERTRQLGVALRQTGQHGQLAAEQSRLQRILR